MVLPTEPGEFHAQARQFCFSGYRTVALSPGALFGSLSALFGSLSPLLRQCGHLRGGQEQLALWIIEPQPGRMVAEVRAFSPSNPQLQRWAPHPTAGIKGHGLIAATNVEVPALEFVWLEGIIPIVLAGLENLL
jgi:hypothetical protein